MSNPFTFDWNRPVDDAERARLIEALALRVRRRGLETPVVWALEVHKPLAPLAAQCGVAFSPILGALIAGGAEGLQKYVKLLQDPKNIDLLIARIEAPESSATELKGAASS